MRFTMISELQTFSFWLATILLLQNDDSLIPFAMMQALKKWDF